MEYVPLSKFKKRIVEVVSSLGIVRQIQEIIRSWQHLIGKDKPIIVLVYVQNQEQDHYDRVLNRALDIESSSAFRQLLYFPGRNILAV
jgi:hypothetical protein